MLKINAKELDLLTNKLLYMKYTISNSLVTYIMLNRLLVKLYRYDSKKSRLVREDDNDLCDDDIRINMQVNTAASDMEKRREAFNAALQDEGKVLLTFSTNTPKRKLKQAIKSNITL